VAAVAVVVVAAAAAVATAKSPPTPRVVPETLPEVAVTNRP